MGTDIDMYIEYRVDGKWETVSMAPVYNDRCYSLFSALAGVRSYSSSGESLKPKDIPVDCCSDISDEHEYFDCHSASHLTLQELYAYRERNPTFKYNGLVSLESAKDLDELGILPDCWCQGSSDETMVYREWEVNYCVMDELIDIVESRAVDDLQLDLQKPFKQQYAERIRIVFWFDC